MKSCSICASTIDQCVHTSIAPCHALTQPCYALPCLDRNVLHLAKPPLGVTMMPLRAPSISKYGSLVRPHAQIVALRLRLPLSMGHIGDPVSCIALVSPGGLVQRRLFRMPLGDKTRFRLRRRRRTMSDSATVTFLLSPGTCQLVPQIVTSLPPHQIVKSTCTMNTFGANFFNERSLVASGGAVMKKKKTRSVQYAYDGGWWVNDGGWWVVGGGWWVTGGGWRVTAGGNMRT